ncbi:MAG: hypothetical protein Q8938_20205 [Bacteroidota bacterium]|nr:hypothetical protein [Bacteroidota bacterium]
MKILFTLLLLAAMASCSKSTPTPNPIHHSVDSGFAGHGFPPAGFVKP